MQTCANAITVAFAGLEARRVEVQVQLTGGTHGIVIVGLGDKAVSESRERVRAAFASIGLAIPPGRLIVNLAPADMPKEGTHYDLPIALAMMAAIGALPHDALDGVVCFGEVGLDGSLAPAPGALPAAMAAHSMDAAFICPEACGAEAAWAGGEVIAAPSLLSLVNHFRGGAAIKAPERGDLISGASVPDLRDVRGQEQAKRALEIAAAGAHNILLVGPPGAGKSMLAQRLPGLLPPLLSEELLEVSMLHSVAGLLERGRLTRTRPFRAPHHSASMAALVGGCKNAEVDVPPQHWASLSLLSCDVPAIAMGSKKASGALLRVCEGRTLGVPPQRLRTEWSRLKPTRRRLKSCGPPPSHSRWRMCWLSLLHYTVWP